MQAKLLKQPAATPETWRCEVEREEFCQFLSGHCVYTADDGTRLEIEGGDGPHSPGPLNPSTGQT